MLSSTDLRRIALGVASVALVAGMGMPAAFAADPYKIGMSIDLTGPISFNGKIAAAGLETYVAKLNDAGGVNGRTVDLTVADDASDLAKGKANEQRFADDGALAIFGFILTNVSAAVAPQAADDEIPIVGLGGLAQFLEPPQPYYFSYELRADKLADRILTYIGQLAKKDGIEKPRVALFVVDTPSNRTMAENAKAEIERLGWTLAEEQFFAISPTDVTAQAAAFKAANPDYILMSHNDAGALVGVRGLRSAGVTTPVINQWAGSADSTLQKLGDGYTAFRTYAGPGDDSVPATADVRAAAEKFGYADQATNSYFTQGYVAGMILEKALTICGEDCADGAQFAKAMEQVGEIDSHGLSGPLMVDESTHEFVTAVRFYQWDAAGEKAMPVSDWIGASGN